MNPNCAYLNLDESHPVEMLNVPESDQVATYSNLIYQSAIKLWSYIESHPLDESLSEPRQLCLQIFSIRYNHLRRRELERDKGIPTA